ncbi:MAG: hypothetical protein AB3X41_00430 [Leptothrix ochracea]|uniref:hypothetical protein n=1 Tax=Leptothrix ochracea TaxID=735331 RepID=UPI0034E2ACFA
MITLATAGNWAKLKKSPSDLKNHALIPSLSKEPDLQEFFKFKAFSGFARDD